MRENPEMNDFLKNHTIIKSDPLDRAMRFSVVAQETRYEITSTEKIRYVFSVCVENECFPV